MTEDYQGPTPPQELVEQWYEDGPGDQRELVEYVATQATRWGADQELEACISAILAHPGFENPELFVELLCAARRPKPPSWRATTQVRTTTNA